MDENIYVYEGSTTVDGCGYYCGFDELTTEESTTVDEPNIVVKPKMDFGKFSELKYGVSGEVFSKGNHQILDIKSFNYDGKGM